MLVHMGARTSSEVMCELLLHENRQPGYIVQTQNKGVEARLKAEGETLKLPSSLLGTRCLIRLAHCIIGS